MYRSTLGRYVYAELPRPAARRYPKLGPNCRRESARDRPSTNWFGAAERSPRAMATSVALQGAAMSTTFDTTTTYAAAQCMDGSFNTLCATTAPIAAATIHF